MTIKTMSDLFLHGLQDLYYAEQQVAKTLPGFAKQASSQDLSSHLRGRVTLAQTQIKRLEEIFGLLGKAPQGITCQAILGLIEEAEELIGDTESGPMRDTAIAASSDVIKGYEITRYSSLTNWAGRDGASGAKVAELLREGLAEEKKQAVDLSGLSRL